MPPMAFSGYLSAVLRCITEMFPAEGALKGILGIICSLYAFIWGWMNAGRFNLQNIMYGWTACIVLAVIGNVLSSMGAQ